MTKQSRFPYDAERRQDAFRKRYLESANFDSLLFRVLWLDDAAPLCRYLESDKPLSAEDRERLAWMLDLKLRPPRRGRRRGRARTPLLDAAFRVCSAVRQRRDAERAADFRQRLPKGRLRELVEQAIKADEARHPSSKGLLETEYVLSRLMR